MHEYGIVQELLSEVDRGVRANAGKRATRVVVTVSAGGIEEEILRGAFDLAKGHTSAEGAELAVQYAPLDVPCLGCGALVHLADPAESSCPACGSSLWQATGRSTVTLTSIEIEV